MWLLASFGLLLVLAETFCSLGPEGCQSGWIHFKSNCYSFNNGRVHFDAAKGICIWKGGSVVSLWRPDEINFVLEHVTKLISRPSSTWLGLTQTKNSRWIWLDGSYFDLSKKDVPPSRPGLCGTITTEKKLKFINCDETVPSFVCKKSLPMLYIPDTMNVTKEDIHTQPTKSTTDVIFERLWPPLLDKDLLDKSKNYVIATIDVNHETDCAYRCYTVDECKLFKVMCKAQRKCNSFICELLSDLKK